MQSADTITNVWATLRVTSTRAWRSASFPHPWQEQHRNDEGIAVLNTFLSGFQTMDLDMPHLRLSSASKGLSHGHQLPHHDAERVLAQAHTNTSAGTTEDVQARVCKADESAADKTGRCSASSRRVGCGSVAACYECERVHACPASHQVHLLVILPGFVKHFRRHPCRRAARGQE